MNISSQSQPVLLLDILFSLKMFPSMRGSASAQTSAEPYLYTVEQCIAENIPFSPGYRDFEGYKGKYPDPKWPGGAKLCVNVVLNYEEGGEYRRVH